MDALVALQQCALTNTWHYFTNNVIHQTSVSSMWSLAPSTTVQSVCWRLCWCLNNLEFAASPHKSNLALRLSVALLKTDEEDSVPITNEELQEAFTSGNTIATGEDLKLVCTHFERWHWQIKTNFPYILLKDKLSPRLWNFATTKYTSLPIEALILHFPYQHHSFHWSENCIWYCK